MRLFLILFAFVGLSVADRCLTVYDVNSVFAGRTAALFDCTSCTVSVQLRLENTTHVISAVLEVQNNADIYSTMSTTHGVSLRCHEAGTATSLQTVLEFENDPDVEVELIVAGHPDEVCTRALSGDFLSASLAIGIGAAQPDAGVTLGGCPDARCFSARMTLQQLALPLHTWGSSNVVVDVVYDAESGRAHTLDMQMEDGSWFRADHLATAADDPALLSQMCSESQHTMFDIARSRQDISSAVMTLRRTGAGICEHAHLSAGETLRLDVVDSANGATAEARQAAGHMADSERLCTDAEQNAVIVRRVEIQSALVEQMTFSGALRCYTGEATLSSADGSETRVIQWYADVHWPSSVESASFTGFDTVAAQLRCISAFGLTTLQLNTGGGLTTPDWALTWSFEDIECATLVGALDGQSVLPAPVAEIVDAFYDGIRFSYEGTGSPNDYLTPCTESPVPSASASLAPSASPVPSASLAPSALLVPSVSSPPVESGHPIRVFVSEYYCKSDATRRGGMHGCTTVFGYENRNSRAVSIPAGTDTNAVFLNRQLQPSTGCPTVFLPGTHSGAYNMTTWPGTPVWRVITSGADPTGDDYCTARCDRTPRQWGLQCMSRNGHRVGGFTSCA